MNQFRLVNLFIDLKIPNHQNLWLTLQFFLSPHESPSRAALEALVRNFADVVAGRPARSQEEIDAEAATFSCRAEQKTRRLIAVFLLQDFTRLSSQVIQSWCSRLCPDVCNNTISGQISLGVDAKQVRERERDNSDNTFNCSGRCAGATCREWGNEQCVYNIQYIHRGFLNILSAKNPTSDQRVRRCWLRAMRWSWIL